MTVISPLLGTCRDPEGAVPDRLGPEALGGPQEDVLPTIFNLANILIGVGVLSVPFALKQSGYFALVLISVVIYVTGKAGKWIGSSIDLVAKSKEAALRPPIAWDYAFLAEVCFGARCKTFMNFVTVTEVWLALVAFMVLSGGNSAIVFPHAPHSLMIVINGAISTLLIFVPPHVYSYLSFLSTIAMFVAALAIIATTSTLPRWAGPYEETIGQADWTNIGNIPRSVGIIIFCFAGHPCFPALRTGMKTPRKWGFCIDVSFLIAFLYYACFGLFGYVVFGADLSQSVADNLAEISGAALGRMVAAICFLIKVQLTFPLLLNVVVVSMWAPSDDGKLWPAGRVALVFAISALTILCATALADKAAVVASLAGSLLVTITSILFPAFVHYRLTHREGHRRLTWFEAAEYSVIVLFGVFMAVAGTALAVVDLAA